MRTTDFYRLVYIISSPALKYLILHGAITYNQTQNPQNLDDFFGLDKIRWLNTKSLQDQEWSTNSNRFEGLKKEINNLANDGRALV